MADLTLRLVKGSPLTNAEVDGNFTSLNESIMVTGEPMGHANKSDSVLSFNAGTRTVSIAPAVTSFAVWCKGTKHLYTTAQTVVIPDTTGLHYVFFNASGVLSTRMSYFDFENEAPTAYVAWNSVTQQASFFADERHGVTLDWQTHEYLHRTRGAALANGFSISNYTIVGTGSADADAQFDLGGGTFFDEDLQVDIVSSNTPTPGTWQQDLAGPALIPVLYRSGAGWVRDTPTNFVLKAGTATPRYNSEAAGVWGLTDVPNNSYSTVWIIATNNLTYPVVAIMGQAADSNSGQVENIEWSSLNLDGFPSVEFRPLYKIVFQCSSGYTNTIKARFTKVFDIRNLVAASPAATIGSAHSGLSGLGNDDHLQYLHVTEVRSPSAAVKASFLPPQASNAGKYLKTDGSVTSWETLTNPNNGTLTMSTAGTGISGSATFTADQAGNSTFTVTLNSSASNVVNTVVLRDGSGNFSGNVITANSFSGPLSGNASTASALLTARSISSTGDVVWTTSFDGSGNATGTANLSTTGVSSSTYGSATQVATFTVDTKGRITAASSVNIAPTWASITGTPTTLAGYGITNGQPLDADLTAIAALTGTSGFLKKTATDTWTLDTSTYVPTNGTGATGTWGISISGNAATATSATDSTKLPLAGGTMTGSISFAQNANLIFGTSTTEAGPWTLSVLGSGGATPATKGTGYGRDIILKAGDSDNGGGLAGGDLYLRGGSPISPAVTYGDVRISNLGGQVYLRAAAGIALGSDNYNSYAPTLTGSGASGTWGINISGNAATATSATSAGYATYSQVLDTRAAQYTPNDYQDFRTTYEFTNQYTGLGDWHSGITAKGWHDGYAAWQIIGPSSTTAHENWYLRSGVNTSWNALRTILHSGNYNSYAPTLTGGGASGTWGINISGNAATATTASTANALNTGNNYTGNAFTASGGYFYANRSAISGQAGIQFQTAGTTNWWNFLDNNTNTLTWYQSATSTSVMTLTQAGALRVPRITAGGSTDTDANLGVQGTSHLTGTIYFGGTVGNVNSWSSLMTSTSGNEVHSVNSFVVNRSGYGGGNILEANTSGYVLGGNKYLADSWLHSDRDFVTGTLITTDINYAVSSGDPWILEIRGNSYGDAVPYDIQYQGYIYSDTIINHGGYSNGTYISGLVALNVGGNLCFWWPRQSYWNGFYVRVYVPYASYPRQRATSITSTAKPSGTKEVALSVNIRQSLHSGNYNSYAPTLTGSGASGTWGIAITGNAATASNASNTNSISNAVGGGYTWTGVQYFQSNLGATSGALNNPPLQVFATGGNSAFMSFHRSGAYAVNMGLDSDNVLRIGGWSASANRWELDMSGNNWVASSFRAPIFYDSSNTGYYLDPASTSELNKVYYNSNMVSRDYGIGQIGRYASTIYQAVWSMGESYLLPANGANTGNLYGIAWSYPGGQGGASNNLASHGMLILENGVFKGAWGGGSLRTPGDVRGTIFYDWDNTSYYVDPASTSRLSTTTTDQSYTYGWFRNYSSNTGLYNQSTTQHLSSTANGYWDVSSTTTVSSIRFYTGGHLGALRGYVYADTGNNIGFLNSGGSWRLRVVSDDYSLAEGTSMRAQLFYDSNNTAYYFDPTSSTSIRTLGEWRADTSGWTGEYAGKIQYHDNSWYLQFSTAMRFRNSGGSDVVTFSSGGNISASGTIAASSDERLKTNWRDLPVNFVEQLAKVKAGVYDRVDVEGMTQVGVSAQSLEPLMPHAVTHNADGMLGVAYGNAALVAAVKLAERVLELERRLAALESGEK